MPVEDAQEERGVEYGSSTGPKSRIDLEDHAKAGKNDQDKPEHSFPEGGARAWAVAIGTAGVLFCTLGYINSFGLVLLVLKKWLIRSI